MGGVEGDNQRDVGLCGGRGTWVDETVSIKVGHFGLGV